MSRKKLAFIAILLAGYGILPCVLAFWATPHPLKTLASFYGAITLILFFVFRKNSEKIGILRLQSSNLEEQINLQRDANAKEIKNQAALRQRISRYTSLYRIIEEINATLSAEDIAGHLAGVVFSLIANGKGTCVLYLVDPQTRTLSLCKTKKEDAKLVIKAKQGDIFDTWVLRHASPLVIEDINKDFRFDLEKIQNEEARAVSSLVSAPLVSGNNFIGLVRLDHPQPGYFDQEDLRFLMTVSDIGAVALENGQLYQHTEDLAIHDGLTGLFTKGHFMELLSLECKTSLRHQRTFSLLMLDIDNFKRYNDTFGHVAGDIVLQSLGTILQEALAEESAVVSRFGGEEFCLILPAKDMQAARDLAERIRTQVEARTITLRRHQTNVTVSIGVATFPADAADNKELIMKADKAMYEAKRSGRNRVEVAR